MMGNECVFCGSEFWDDEKLCYGCRLTLPRLARTLREARVFMATFSMNSANKLRKELRKKTFIADFK